jgi:hypothetical protein
MPDSYCLLEPPTFVTKRYKLSYQFRHCLFAFSLKNFKLLTATGVPNLCPMNLVTRIYNISGNTHPARYSVNLMYVPHTSCPSWLVGSIFNSSVCSRPGQSKWDLWWEKWHWDRFFSDSLCFPLSIPFHRRSQYSYIIREINSKSASGSSSET